MRAVRAAYDNRCAISGIRLINGGGRPEVQAAHIKPVASNGPDSIRNGLALSGTLHWLFDRGLVSVSDDHEILVAEKHVPDQVLRMLNANRKLITPAEASLRPNPRYLKFHRENVFKG
jgi:putative restriction endonuclease